MGCLDSFRSQGLRALPRVLYGSLRVYSVLSLGRLSRFYKGVGGKG